MTLRRPARTLTAISLAAASMLLLGATRSDAAVPLGANGPLVLEFRDSDGEIGLIPIPGPATPYVRRTNDTVDDQTPQLSPDSNKIVWNRAGEIWIQDADGTDRKRLTEPGGDKPDAEPSWSGDGKKIAFRRFDGTQNDIWMMDADGENEIRLTSDPGTEFAPSFSPDSSKIVFVRETGSGSASNEIMLMPAVRNASAVPLTDDSDPDGEPAFSGDGGRIVFRRDTNPTSLDNDIWLMDADGSNEIPLVVTNTQEISPSFSPDGTRIAFSRGRAGSQGADEVFDVSVSGGGERNFTNTPAIDEPALYWGFGGPLPPAPPSPPGILAATTAGAGGAGAGPASGAPKKCRKGRKLRNGKCVKRRKR